jgi:Cobyrinic acid a,c-diamide synthase
MGPDSYASSLSKIVVAYDEVLCFCCQENFDILRSLGAELEFFSHVKDGLAKFVISEKKEHRMAGVLPASTIMARRFQALGYVEGKVVGENPVAATGKTIRGHEFHYVRMDCARDAGSHTGSPWARGSWTARTDGAKRAGELSAHSCVFVSDG